jgi:hypothetical protein
LGEEGNELLLLPSLPSLPSLPMLPLLLLLLTLPLLLLLLLLLDDKADHAVLNLALSFELMVESLGG